MAAKIYWLKFGSGDARQYAGLAPTFLQFFDSTGQTYAPPSITEIKYGGVTLSGIYGFSYTIGISTANSLYFLAYSATTLANPSDNYVTGVLDPVAAVDQQLTVQGTTLVAIGNTGIAIGTSTLAVGTSTLAVGTTALAFNILQIGATTSTYGSTSLDPSSLFGYLKRIQELLEGDQVFTSATGSWLMYNRASLGTTTLLRTKSVISGGSSVNKTGI